MSNARSIFRLCLASLGLILACGILMSKAGFSIIGCDQGCTEIGNLWFSWFFLFGLLAGNGAYIYFVRKGKDQHRFWLALGLGGASIAAFLTMAIIRTLCPICVVAQVLWIALALDALAEKSPRLVFAGCILMAAWVGYAIHDSNRPYATPVSFPLRGYEQVRRGAINGIVVFTDPSNPSCREVARRFDESKSPLPVIYRWNVPSQGGERSIRLIAAIESALQTDPTRGIILRREILTLSNPSDRTQLERAVRKSSLSMEQFDNWMKFPEASSLELVRQDSELAKKLWLKRTPSLCILYSGEAANYPSVHTISRKDLRVYESVLKGSLSMFDVYLTGTEGGKP